MPAANETAEGHDRWNLNRFVEAQEQDHARALAEIRQGRKRSHWIWYVFPQLAGLGYSHNAHYYGIANADEARAYLDHPLLGARLTEISQALMEVQGKTAHEILGSPDDLKVRSCATLFAAASPPGSVFQQLLDKFYDGTPDSKTLELLGK